ncbi:MAG TPA: hypothetical protein VNI20_02230 [Fimbriimonadaceae bacterium]|nr:hypothetical protein [Fimbriimonadaceae bacterium]
MFQQDVAWSPDGKWIAYSQLTNPEKYDAKNWSVWTVRDDGSQSTKIADEALWVAWSNDGRAVAYTKLNNGKRDIYRYDLATKSETVLISSHQNDTQPAWSPDGRLIAYASDRSGAGYDIWIANADGTGVRQLTAESGSEYMPKWSPDSKRITYYRVKGDQKDQVWMIDVDMKSEMLLSSGNYRNLSPVFVGSDRVAFYCSGRELGTFPVTNLEGTVVATIKMKDAFTVAESPQRDKYAFIINRSPASEIFVKDKKSGRVTKVAG